MPHQEEAGNVQIAEEQLQHQMNFKQGAINNSPSMMMMSYSPPMSSPTMYPSQWATNGSPFGYTSHQMHSPSMSSTSSFSPIGDSTKQVPFPDSPTLPDAAQMLMSPSRFRKRRHLSPLISGYNETALPAIHSNQQMPMLPYMRPAKVPMSPKSVSLGNSPKSRQETLILPCFFDQNNVLRAHNPTLQSRPNSYWDDFRRNVASFLKEAAAVDEANITIVEIKQLLRKYSINATGKKVVLMERIRKMQAFLQASSQEVEKNRAETVGWSK